MKNLTEILDQLIENTDGKSIKLKEMVNEFENQGFGPLILAPGLIAFLPTGAIPGIPAVCGLFIIIVAVQILIGRKHPWLPGKLANFSFSRDRLKKTSEKVKPWTVKIDKFVTTRFEFMTDGIFPVAIALISILLSASMIPLEAIPFAVAAPSFGVVMLGLGLSARDGLLIILGFCAFFTTAYMTWILWPF